MIEFTSDRVLLRIVGDSVAVIFIELDLLCVDIVVNVVVDALYEVEVSYCLVLLPLLVYCIVQGQQDLHFVLEVTAEVFRHDPLISCIVVLKHRSLLGLAWDTLSTVLACALGQLALNVAFS